VNEPNEPLSEVARAAAALATSQAEARKLRIARDESIRTAIAEGHTMRAVADAAGITSALVHRIVHRESR
jgi:hypothetical protein